MEIPAEVSQYWELWYIWASGRESMNNLQAWPWHRICDAVNLLLAEAEYQRIQAENNQ